MIKRLWLRVLVGVLTMLPAVVLASLVVPGFSVHSIGAALGGVLVLSLLNAFVRPVLVRLTLPINILTVGTFSLLLNGLMIVLVQVFIDGWSVSNILSGILVSFILTLMQTLIANTLLARQDHDLYLYQLIQRYARKDKKERTEFDSPGLIMLEVDGLSEPVLRQAMDNGYMPFLRSLIDGGEYRLLEWDSGLPSQTSAMQAGILHGSHFNIPAFRYYDKASDRLFVSNRPGSAAEMLRPLSNGEGLLAHDGFGLNNWATGDAGEFMLTFAGGASALEIIGPSDSLYQFFVNFNNVQQVLADFAADLVREWWQALQQRRHKVEPRISRRYPYPLVRAATTALLPYLSVYLLLGKMFEGVGAIYTTFVSYDEVAHHSGPNRVDSLKVLTQLDGQIRMIMGATPYVHRKYEFVILSDHGQTIGATFRQRYGFTLGEFVNRLLGSEAAIIEQLGGDEAMGNINLLADELTRSNRWLAKRARTLVQRRGDEPGVVRVFRTDEQRKSIGTEDGDPRAKTIVVASGNLGLIYFTHWPERLTLEAISAEFPGFLAALASHPGIGLVVVQSEARGPVALGPNHSLYFFDDDSFTGENPLAVFGPNAADHLRSLNTYPSMPDVLVNSFYDPAADEGAAFEELVGFHGGLGGEQNQPFLMFPAHLQPDELPPIVGADAVYHLIRSWQEMLQGSQGTQTANRLRPRFHKVKPRPSSGPQSARPS